MRKQNKHYTKIVSMGYSLVVRNGRYGFNSVRFYEGEKHIYKVSYKNNRQVDDLSSFTYAYSSSYKDKAMEEFIEWLSYDWDDDIYHSENCECFGSFLAELYDNPEYNEYGHDSNPQYSGSLD